MELQAFLSDMAAAEYAQAAYDHLEVIRNLRNTTNEGGAQIDGLPGVPA